VGSAPAPGSYCNGSVWIVPSNVTNINSTAGQTIVIAGSIELPPTATVQVSGSSAPIVVDGTAVLGGTLTIVLTSIPSSGTTLPILTAANISGEFAGVSVQPPPGSECVEITATPQVITTSDGATLSALLQVVDSCSTPGRLSTGAIAGIVVGCVLAAIAAIVVVVLVASRNKKGGWHVRASEEKDEYVI